MELRWEGPGRGAAGVETQGGDSVFWVRAVLPRGLWRLVALGEGGELTLGTAEGGAVQLRRQFSPRLTRPLGAPWAVTARRSGEDWCSGDGGPAFSLPAGVRWQRLPTGWRIACPWQVGEPFPREDLFCFARICTMEGREWVLYVLDEAGEPVISQ